METTGFESKARETIHTTPVADEDPQLFRLLVDAVKDYGIFLLDPNGIILSFNAGAERISGYNAREVIGRHFSVFYTQNDIDKNHPTQELAIALKMGRYEEEGWRVRQDGTRFWANVIISPMHDAQRQHIGFAKVTRDLTERREAEERLRRSEERSRLMFEGVKDYAMITLEPNGTIATWNEGARRIKGYETFEIVGRHFSCFYPESDVRMGKCEYELKEAIETGRYEEEGWRVRKDGTKFWASVILTATRDRRGNLIGFSKVTRDFTDRKRAEDLLRMAYAEMEKRVEERTQELRTANEHLQKAIQVRDEFMSVASHELRTPITPLKMQVQALIRNVRRKSFDALNEERMNRMAEACDRSLSRLTLLVDNLLDVARISSGHLRLNHEPVELRSLLRELIERYKSEISVSGSRVHLEITQDITVSADRVRFEQVLVNLLTNALKYGESKPIHIAVQLRPENVLISVRDHGRGIDQQDCERIFEKFERAAGVSNLNGLGLGLYITRQIVESHGGRILVESDLGSGSTFSVILPVDSIEHSGFPN
ncbi:MAG: PAS domain S-box protein [Bdellovibrionales bacterium]|nr:PAS domain S-box protein [Bdellovibrionales bacterium]